MFAIDDATRLAYVEVPQTSRRRTNRGFLAVPFGWVSEQGDNLSPDPLGQRPSYRSDDWRKSLPGSGSETHPHQAPYTPQTTQGRSIKTLAEWAYVIAYQTFGLNATAWLPRYLGIYNGSRCHRLSVPHSLSKCLPAAADREGPVRKAHLNQQRFSQRTGRKAGRTKASPQLLTGGQAGASLQRDSFTSPQPGIRA